MGNYWLHLRKKENIAVKMIETVLTEWSLTRDEILGPELMRTTFSLAYNNFKEEFVRIWDPCLFTSREEVCPRFYGRAYESGKSR
jgi:hypothetical protein